MEVGTRVKLPFGNTGTIVKIKNIPWGFKYVVRIRKPSIFHKTNQRVDYKEEQLEKE